MCHSGKKVVEGLLSFLMIIFTIAGSVGQVQSQEKYPTRAIDLVLPFSAAGATDLVERVTAGYLNKRWRVPVNAVNKPGGNTVPASLEVYHATPDGYTMLGDTQGTSTLGVVVKNLPFKVLDRTFVVMMAATPLVFIVPANSPFKSLKDLEAEAKRSPEEFTYTSIGGATGMDITTRQFFKAIGVDVLKTKAIITQGGGQAIILTAGGHVKMGLGGANAAIAAITGGTVRPIAVSSPVRYPECPEVPTTAELGYPTVKCMFWIGVSGPPKLPSHIIDAWDKGIQEMLKDPQVLKSLRNVGAVPYYYNSSAMRDYVIRESEEVRELFGSR